AMLVEKQLDDLLVLVRLERARGVDERATTPDRGRRGGEDARLVRPQAHEVGLGAPPLHVRIPPEHAEIRAGRVDEGAVRAPRPSRGKIADRPRVRLDDADAEARGPARREP